MIGRYYFFIKKAKKEQIVNRTFKRDYNKKERKK